MTPLLKNPVWGILTSPVSLIYGTAITIRNILYNTSILKIHSVDTPVISVGNISVGGTGKTPLVEFIADKLLKEGHKPAVISRGYKRKGKGIITVFDGSRFLVSPSLAGDEPYLIAKTLSEIPVVVGSNRYDAALYTQNLFNPDVIILDDAFQHRRLNRNINIVIIDSSNPWGNRSLLPGGPLREPLSSLKRADVVVLSRVNESGNTDIIFNKIRPYYSAPVVLSGYVPESWVGLNNNIKDIGTLKGKSVIAFTATGNPDSFRRTLKNTSVNIADFIHFKDHHWFTQKDINRITDKAKAVNAEALVTTEKDMVRLYDTGKTDLPVYSLRIRVDILQGINYFNTILENCFKNKINPFAEKFF